jgi:hypothetical protein
MTRLDEHHPYGAAIDPLTVPRCEHCHQDLTELQREYGLSFQPAATVPGLTTAYLRGFAAHVSDFISWGEHAVKRATQLADALEAPQVSDPGPSAMSPAQELSRDPTPEPVDGRCARPHRARRATEEPGSGEPPKKRRRNRKR